jgi:hemolysin D
MTKTAVQHPLTELLERYRAIFAASWQARYELAGPQRMSDEIAFLPAALSLQDTPVHPAPRRLAWALMTLFLLAVLWACIGKIGIVASAPGRIVVSNGTKVIQPLETSVVRKVLVKDGDRVEVGQVLIELDPTNANADKANIKEQLNTASSEVQRTSALLKAITANSLDMATLTGDSEPISSQLLAEWQDINSKLSKLDAEVSHRRAEIATVKEIIAKLQATLPIAMWS